jgi:branched-chain amino acid transport system substrate-binding protein
MGLGRKISQGFGVVCVAALALALAACSSASTTTGGTSGGTETQAGGTYKVGAILSLTGSYAPLGASEKNSLDLEVKRINDAGGVAGKKIDLVIEDDGTDEAKAVAAASKLIGQDNVVAILGATGTGQSMAARSEIDRAGIPEISMAGGSAITATFDPLVFQTPWPNKIVVPFVLDKIVADGHKKIAVISDSGGYGKDGLAVIVSEAPKKGMTVVSNQTFNPGDTDFSAQLTKAKSSGAEAVLLWTAGKEGASIVKSAGDLGVKLPMYGGSGQASVKFVQGAGPAGDGFVFGTGKSLVPSNWGAGTPEFAAVNGFAERYKAAYGQDPDIFAGHAFDALNILADALKRTSGDASPKALRDAIEGTSQLNGFGGAFTYSSTDHNGLTVDDLALYTVKAGAWAPIK